ncbi:mechanosensitive ion channel family protein [Crocinitomicaceae bacterium]|jgi:MscS family membrane protein|nr:mechanosensitive ion channel family protein [Crocinitomicaceae bacterium]MDG1035360.1 mechanosensitive ion channel family protein [Crocinitomicaceae bacterium]
MNVFSILVAATSNMNNSRPGSEKFDKITRWFDKQDWSFDWFFSWWGQNTTISIIVSILILVGAIVIGKLLYWLIGTFAKSVAARTKSGLDDILIDKLEEPIVYGIVILGFYWGFTRLHFNESVDSFFANVFMILFILNVTWLIARVIDSLIEEYIVPIVTKSESDLDDQLLPILRKTIKAVLWIFGIVIALSNSGFDVAALIAGLGIGGLALALAAQDTVKNIFGGIMVFLDKPFKIKDRIKVNGMDGVVEEIGVRSTRLRTLEGRLITIPNGQFSDNAVENVSLEPTRKVNISLGLTYDTTPEQMENAMNIIKDIIKANSKVEDDALVAFNAWGDFAMGIQVIYYISSPDFIFSAQSEINLEILKLFNAEGLEFAFPTQTIYKKEL